MGNAGIEVHLINVAKDVLVEADRPNYKDKILRGRRKEGFEGSFQF